MSTAIAPRRNIESRPKDGAAVDPITLEVVRNALVAIVREMTDNLIRTAYSPIAAEIKDFSVGLLDARGNSIAQAPNGLPLFVADLGATIKAGLQAFADEGFENGDVILSNDAATNGQHLNNVVVFSPIIIDGKVVAFPAVRSHWIDVGGMTVGSIPVDARDIFSEGIQIPYVKVYRAGKPDRAIVRLLETNTRFPDLNMGDMRAQISACRLGERRFIDLIARYGKEMVIACIHRIWDEAEIVSRRAVEQIPDGTYEAGCRLDNDGINLDRPIPLKVKVTIQGSNVTVDFSGMPPQVDGPYNSRAADTIARVAFKYLTTPHLAANEGAFRNLRVVCPEGTIVSADPRAPMAWFNMGIVSSIDLILRALHSALPNRITAGNPDNIGTSNVTGIDPRNGRLFQTFIPYVGGWGAQPMHDGTSAVVSLVQGDVRVMPVEVRETLYPIRVTEFALREDSGGPGTWRGGLGIVTGHEVLVDCDYNAQFERTLDPPWGLAGGMAGLVSKPIIRRTDGTCVRPPNKTNDYRLKAGEVESLYSAGGGGFGPPHARDPDRVREDVLDGIVSMQAAREAYGVVIDPQTLEVDRAATDALRNQ
jgi:N-methylhydantoinase B